MIDIIFSIGAILISLSYLATNMLVLRIISIIGASVYIAGGILAGYHAAGMKALIVFSLINLLINLIQSIKIIIDRIPILLPHDLHAIYTNSFYNMSTKDFLTIYKLSNQKTAEEGAQLTIQNEPVTHLMMIKEGNVNIIKDNQLVATLKEGYFIGEMSYLTEGNAMATAIVKSEKVEYIDWDKKVLATLQTQNPMLYIKLKKAIGIDLIKKIDQHLQADIAS